jgi:diamine N-acetyltransferase
MIERRNVTRETLWPLINLDVAPGQRDLVTDNRTTFAEAAYEPGAAVWGLWQGETPVGLMAMVDPVGVAAHGPFLDPAAAYLWRLMIAKDHQGQGYGAQALGFAAQSARDWGAPRLVVGVRDVAHGNRGFYERFGFRDSGVIEEEDRLFVLDLPVRE